MNKKEYLPTTEEFDKLGFIIEEVRLLTEKCNRDIQIKNLTRGYYYLRQYNSLVDATKELEAEIEFKPISIPKLGWRSLVVNQDEEVLAIMSKVDYAACELLNDLEYELRLRTQHNDLPVDIFDSLELHPIIVEASRSLFLGTHYSDAIFRAFTAVKGFVKEKSHSDEDGRKLMSTVFDVDKPKIKLNNLSTESDRDEQEGFKFLYMGGQIGVRNPKAHDNVTQSDPYRTLKYLSLASLLLERAQEGTLAI